ncbi:uncharacterized protein LOC132552226 [Ylistrum balloti]|uniref:uncharacterized protein LOC132552226 n=1 Tax=Ylistrum balloti TaxID=509963 RepID=UPI002905BF6B|nr:uncharacterized protein LOC132552226 [Ylistrum balloti]
MNYNPFCQAKIFIFVLSAIAASLSPAEGIPLVKECTRYKPFVKDWICQKETFDAHKINYELLSSQIVTGTRRQYHGSKYIPETSECVVDIDKPAPVIAKVKTRHRLIQFEELCKMRKIPIWNVFHFLNIGNRTQRFECIVVNTDWTKQDMYYAECVNPVVKSHDKCQMDYGTREEFRCVQSGFVEKRILVYCPAADDYAFKIVKVPTTCSCRKCFHCEGTELLFADLLAGLNNRFTQPITPIKVKPMGCSK